TVFRPIRKFGKEIRVIQRDTVALHHVFVLPWMNKPKRGNNLMLKSLRKTLGVAGLSAAMVFGAAAPANAADDTITFGWTAWADAEFVTKLAKETIENNWDYD